MIKTPQSIAKLFNQQLAERSIPEASRPNFCKWLRFYLDFCHKYGFTGSEKNSLAAFIDKLKEKKQNLYNQQGSDLWNTRGLAGFGQIYPILCQKFFFVSFDHSTKSTESSNRPLEYLSKKSMIWGDGDKNYSPVFSVFNYSDLSARQSCLL